METPVTLTRTQLATIKRYILKELPKVLAQDPDFATLVEGIVAEKFPRRDEFARLLEQMEQQRRENAQQFTQITTQLTRVESVEQTHHQETQTQISQLGGRVDNLEKKVDDGFWDIHRTIDRLGSRWGIRNEKVFRQTVSELLEKTFGMQVEERHIRGEQFDCIISNGTHILIEVAASAGPNIVKRMERKRQLYIDETGVVPARFLVVVGAIHSRRAEALREAGFEIIEPEDTDEPLTP